VLPVSVDGANGALEKLRILSLARNNLKKISGLEELADSLEELWLSYNQIEKLGGLAALKKLRVLYIGNNRIKGADELTKLVTWPGVRHGPRQPLSTAGQSRVARSALRRKPFL
jgi:hypothetical protein